MFYVYVLKSQRDNGLYIGFTGDLRRRLSEHNAGLSQSTKTRGPWQLAYYEAYAAERDARIRENRLKEFKNSYARLKNRILNSLKA